MKLIVNKYSGQFQKLINMPLGFVHGTSRFAFLQGNFPILFGLICLAFALENPFCSSMPFRPSEFGTRHFLCRSSGTVIWAVCTWILFLFHVFWLGSVWISLCFLHSQTFSWIWRLKIALSNLIFSLESTSLFSMPTQFLLFFLHRNV